MNCVMKFKNGGKCDGRPVGSLTALEEAWPVCAYHVAEGVLAFAARVQHIVNDPYTPSPVDPPAALHEIAGMIVFVAADIPARGAKAARQKCEGTGDHAGAFRVGVGVCGVCRRVVKLTRVGRLSSHAAPVGATR